jgi:hypothetical protein
MRRMDFADPEAGQVGSQLVVDENASTPVIYQVRLAVVQHEITEIESVAVRQLDGAKGFFTPANMQPQPVFNQAIDPAKRMSRDQLTAEVDLYVEYLEGKTDASGVHFDQSCARYENGVATASGLSSFQLQRLTSLVVGELFKLIDGKIMMIQAVMANMPTKAWD